MYKIRLLILLLISYTKCTPTALQIIILKHLWHILAVSSMINFIDQLKSQLNNLGIFIKIQNLKFKQISHTQDLFITNIDKTQTEKNTVINLRIFNKVKLFYIYI